MVRNEKSNVLSHYARPSLLIYLYNKMELVAREQNDYLCYWNFKDFTFMWPNIKAKGLEKCYKFITEI